MSGYITTTIFYHKIVSPRLLLCSVASLNIIKCCQYIDYYYDISLYIIITVVAISLFWKLPICHLNVHESDDDTWEVQKYVKLHFFTSFTFLCMLMGVRYWNVFGRKLDLGDLIVSPYKDHKTYLKEINIIKLDLMKPYAILSLFNGTDSKLIFLPIWIALNWRLLPSGLNINNLEMIVLLLYLIATAVVAYYKLYDD